MKSPINVCAIKTAYYLFYLAKGLGQIGCQKPSTPLLTLTAKYYLF